MDSFFCLDNISRSAAQACDLNFSKPFRVYRFTMGDAHRWQVGTLSGLGMSD
ncbi:MAG: hypothetical protein V4577_30630 [Bacteroidota bacterium]